MKSFFTIATICISAFFATATKAQTYSYAGTVVPAQPSAGQLITVNFSLTTANIQPNLVIYVYNSFLGTYAALPTTTTFGGFGFFANYLVPANTPNNTTLQFTVGTAGSPTTYFGIVVSSVVLPVIFKSYSATLASNDKVSIKWELASTDGIDKTVIYRSTDGSNFTPIQTVKGSASQYVYSYTDLIDGSSSYFYKIVCVSLDGDKITSNTLYVNSGSGTSVSTPKILNNAHVGSQLFISGINLSNYKAGDVNIIDAMGRKYPATIQSSNTIATSNLSAGMYYLKIGANQPLNFLAQ